MKCRAKTICLKRLAVLILAVLIFLRLPILPDEVVSQDEPWESSCFRTDDATVATWDYYPVKQQQSVKEPNIHLDTVKCFKLELDTSPPKRRTPSSGSCDGYDGVFLIQETDKGSASGTIFFQLMVAMLQWADQHNYLPHVHLFNASNDKVYDNVVHGQGPITKFNMLDGMEIGFARDPQDPQQCSFPGQPQLSSQDGLRAKEFVLDGTGVWEHYFEPLSDFVPGDPSCRDKPIVTMNYLLVVHGIHSQAPWSPRPWRYWMPKYMEQPDVPLQQWLDAQRRPAVFTTRRYIRFNEEMEQRAACAHPHPKNSLGLHIRAADKENRYLIEAETFLPYCVAFVMNGGGEIYVATDSALVLKEILHTWPKSVRSHIVHQSGVQGLSHNKTAAFDLDISTHRSNVEALTDLLALSKCTYMLHGLSALSEAVFFLSPDLMERSLNLEDEEQEYTVDYLINTILARGRPQ